MSFDDVLIGFITGGIALSALYMKSEYALWRHRAAAERRRVTLQAQLHIARLAEQRPAGLLEPKVTKRESFARSEAAISQCFSYDRRSPVRSAHRREHFQTERRVRLERHAAH